MSFNNVGTKIGERVSKMEVRNSNLSFGTKVIKQSVSKLSKEAKYQIKIASKVINRNSAPGKLAINGTGKDSLQLSYINDGSIKYGFVNKNITFENIVETFKNILKESQK